MRRRRGAQRPARRPRADHRRQLLDGLADHRSVLRCAPFGTRAARSKSAETFPWISITRRAFASSASARSARRRRRAFSAPSGFGLRPRGRAERLQRPGVALLAPLAQERRVQALAAQQLTDLARPRARVGLAQDPQLVLGRERPALGLLDQLGVRDPRRRGAPGGPSVLLSGSRGGCPPRLPQNRTCAVRIRLLGTAGCEPRRRPVSATSNHPRSGAIGGGVATMCWWGARCSSTRLASPRCAK